MPHIRLNRRRKWYLLIAAIPDNSARSMGLVNCASSLNDNLRRLVWTAQGGTPGLTHYNGAVQVFPQEAGGSRVIWTADVLPDEAAPAIEAMMKEGAKAMNVALARLADQDRQKT
jgi:carbon monoxide dehydrogenase subunit G